MPPRFAVIGAGVSGAFCSKALHRYGANVTVFEAGRGPGGRMASRKEGQVQFDHGAQFFYAKHPVFLQEIDDLKRAGIIKEWHGRFAVVDLNADSKNMVLLEDKTIHARLVGSPSQSAICRHLLEKSGINVQYGSSICAMERINGMWSLFRSSKPGVSPEKVGDFDGVVLADRLCADPNSRLYCTKGVDAQTCSKVPRLLAQVQSRPCFVLMLAFHKAEAPELPFDAAKIKGSSVLSWIARDTSKPDRCLPQSADLECWVVHTTEEFAKRRPHLLPRAAPRLSPQQLQDIAAELLAELRAIGAKFCPQLSSASPALAVAHRWGGAFPDHRIRSSEGHVNNCLLDDANLLAACGDYFGAQDLDSDGIHELIEVIPSSDFLLK